MPRFPLSAVLAFACLSLWTPLTAQTEPPPSAAAPSATTALWYERPAAQWVEALPVGNGRLGAMVFGGVEHERLQLNEDTLWAGGPYNPANPAAKAALPEIRRLLADGKPEAAQKLTQDAFMSIPVRQMPYQGLGDLLLTMPGGDAYTGYQRSLDLDTAIARTEFKVGNILYIREVFSSPVDQVLVVRLTARDTKGPNRPSRLSLSVDFASPQVSEVRAEGPTTLILSGTNSGAFGIPGALRFEARAQVAIEGGTVAVAGQHLQIDNADAVTLLVAAATSYKRFDDVSGDPAALNRATLAAASAKSYEALRAAHIAEHQRLFRRVSLDLGHTPAADLPTDARVHRSPTVDDPALASLYFNYGRYLLISSSRPGDQPANLQGIWADGLTPPWGSKYTVNINTEMNYWPSETTNLAETGEPLFRMIEDLSITGAKLAREHYGASRGWVTHHNTDLWRATGPIDSAFYGMWPTGGAWLCRHLWEHFLFSGDRTFLARAYPLMKGSAEFFLDTMVTESTHGWLVTSPTMSPENSYRRGVTMAQGTAMDSQIIRDLFRACVEASTLLGVDESFRAETAAALKKLPPDQVGAQGQLQEWLTDLDGQAPDPQHRHVSHLYGFFPGAQINLRDHPALSAGVRQTLVTRGDLTTGWAIAWRINLWARLRDAERTHTVLRHLLGPERTYPNLFDAHPPFQIDGNFGGTAAIAEMLLQSHLPVTPGVEGDLSFELHLLPTLPSAWANGSVSGLRARGGVEVALTWRNSRVTSATLRASRDASFVLVDANARVPVSLKAGETFTWNPPSTPTP